MELRPNLKGARRDVRDVAQQIMTNSVGNLDLPEKRNINTGKVVSFRLKVAQVQARLTKAFGVRVGYVVQTDESGRFATYFIDV